MEEVIFTVIIIPTSAQEYKTVLGKWIDFFESLISALNNNKNKFPKLPTN